jgi:hypothetical protein
MIRAAAERTAEREVVAGRAGRGRENYEEQSGDGTRGTRPRELRSAKWWRDARDAVERTAKSEMVAGREDSGREGDGDEGMGVRAVGAGGTISLLG